MSFGKLEGETRVFRQKYQSCSVQRNVFGFAQLLRLV